MIVLVFRRRKHRKDVIETRIKDICRAVIIQQTNWKYNSNGNYINTRW